MTRPPGFLHGSQRKPREDMASLAVAFGSFPEVDRARPVVELVGDSDRIELLGSVPNTASGPATLASDLAQQGVPLQQGPVRAVAFNWSVAADRHTKVHQADLGTRS